MKKTIINICLVLGIAAVALFSMSACTYRGEISNNNIEEFTESGLSFFLDKDASYKDAVLNATNEVIEELGHDKIAELIAHHNKLIKGEDSTLSFDLPNLNDNTNGILVVFSSVDGPPFDYLGEGNKVIGMEIDIFKFVAEKLNKKIETRICVFGAIIQNVTADSTEWRVSGVGVRVTPEREEVVAFSNSYWTMKLNIISKEKDNFSSVVQLNDKKIGVYTGESGAVFMQEKKDDNTLSSKTKIIEYATPQSAFQAFLSGKVDTIVVLDYVADGLVNNR